jgi:hypothetical protein
MLLHLSFFALQMTSLTTKTAKKMIAANVYLGLRVVPPTIVIPPVIYRYCH